MRAQGLRRVLTTAAVVLGAPLAVTALAVAQVSLPEAFEAPFKAIGLVEGDSGDGERGGSDDPARRRAEPSTSDGRETGEGGDRAAQPGGERNSAAAGALPESESPQQAAGAAPDSPASAAAPPAEGESTPPAASPPAGPAASPKPRDGGVDAAQDTVDDTVDAVNDQVQGVLDEVGELVPPLDR